MVLAEGFSRSSLEIISGYFTAGFFSRESNNFDPVAWEIESGKEFVGLDSDDFIEYSMTSESERSVSQRRLPISC
jgi:hypothetical protein